MRAYIALLACGLAIAATESAVAVTTTTLTYQQGTDGYSGTVERRIGRAEAEQGDDPVDTVDASFYLDGGPTASDRKDLLIRFENTSIPSGAVILNASLGFTTSSVTSNNVSGGAFNVYSLSSPFGSDETFDSYTGGNGLDGGTAMILGSFDGMTTVETTSYARIDREMQLVANGGTSYGFGVRTDRSGDGWSYHTSVSSAFESRPTLNVTYTMDSGVELQTQNPTVDIFPNGVNADTAGTLINGNSADQYFLDGEDLDNNSYDQPYLVQFGGLDLSEYDEIVQAELVLVTGFSNGASDSPGPFTVHQIMQPWDENTTYESLDSDSDASSNETQELIDGGFIAEEAQSIIDMNDTEVLYIDVQSIVENWRAGDANYGLYIASGGTGNGWQIFTSGATEAGFQPELRVVGRQVPEPGSIALAVLGIVGLLAARRR
ncbi:PEP-CTERM sorting domain-containing protein [Aeoliella mucimassa]|uniref:Ice-binding protein C-terminal domain-containing protein n=1 Tax=Aeoliella mucimassa TaxID=2527972 RepID=A0A518ATU0_9BACT|nr:PEP-CTERM sorting domain-containing protein [Aeoliella mucimassa]QDU58138.1 hypothetical protein Pan181_43650 [Aeoliella mucimassa]